MFIQSFIPLGVLPPQRSFAERFNILSDSRHLHGGEVDAMVTPDPPRSRLYSVIGAIPASLATCLVVGSGAAARRRRLAN